ALLFGCPRAVRWRLTRVIDGSLHQDETIMFIGIGGEMAPDEGLHLSDDLFSGISQDLGNITIRPGTSPGLVHGEEAMVVRVRFTQLRTFLHDHGPFELEGGQRLFQEIYVPPSISKLGKL